MTIPVFTAGPDPAPVGNPMIRLSDIPPGRLRVACISSIPCVPGAAEPDLLPDPSTLRPFMDNFAKFANLTTRIFLYTIEDAHFLIEPGLDGIVLVDGQVVRETQRFRIYRDASRNVCSGTTITPPRNVAERFETAFLGCDPGWLNYMHWLSLNVPRMIVAAPHLPPETPFVLPDYGNYEGVPQPPAFSREVWSDSLRFPGISSGRTLQLLKPGLYFARHLTLAHIDDWIQTAWISHKTVLRSFAKTAEEMAEAGADLPRRFFISRDLANDSRLRFSSAERRRFDDVLRRWDVRPVALETLSLSRQIALFQQAELVIAPHGAGLVNILFGGPTLRILELHKRFGPERAIRSLFFYIAALKGQTYAFLDADREDGVSADVDAALASWLADRHA